MFNSKSEIRFMNLDVDNSGSTGIMRSLAIPGYKIIKLLGKGAHGLVFKGIDEKSHRKVAIKVLKPSLQEDRDALRRFHRELKVVSGLSHPYIIKIFSVGKTGKNFIVMEYLKYNLKNRLQKKGGKLPKREALKIVRRLAKALEYAHSKGVIHRDIKPANILFRKKRHPVLADFGLVKDLDFKDDGTKPFTIIGTPQYMSPEQCKAAKADHLSDIYSLGVVLFEMLSGKLPYNGESWPELYKQHTDPSIPIPLLSREAKDCQPLIELMLAKDENMRIHAAQVRAMIEEILSGPEQSKSKGSHRNNYLSQLVIVLIITLLITLILILFLI